MNRPDPSPEHGETSSARISGQHGLSEVLRFIEKTGGQFAGWAVGESAKRDFREAGQWQCAHPSAEWTEKDYQAASKWHASAPRSSAKSATVGVFAAKVHPDEPETAMQWLETLPEGADRGKALEAILRRMQEKKNHDKEAVQAFAREHGLSR